MKKTSLLLAATLFATPAFAQSDDCAGAGALVDGAGTAFDTSSATASLPAWPCALGGGPDIWYTFTTTLQADLEISTCNSATYDTAIEVFTGDCNNLVSIGCNDDGAGCTGFTSTLNVVDLPMGTTVYIRIGGYNGSLGVGTVILTETATVCSPADSLEDNDDCGSATPLSPGTTMGLNVAGSDSDFYSIVVPPGDSLIADISFLTANGDLDLYVWDPSIACDSRIEGEGAATALAIGFSVTDNESVSVPNLTTSPLTLILEVDVYSQSAFQCNDYDLTIAVGVDPCYVADAFEDNDDCPSAVTIANGPTGGLNVNLQDGDFYSVTVPSNGTLTVDTLFLHADGDIDLYLWDPLFACDTAIEGEGGATALAVGFSASDDENISYTNATGADQNLIIEVDVYSFSGSGCNFYDLIISGAGNTTPGPIGTSYCSQNVNSTGQIGTMSAFGLTSVGANDCTLTASNLPNQQFGIFVVSAMQGFVPMAGGSSNGNICLGGLVGRYDQTGQILGTGGTGSFSLTINLPTIPQGNNNVPTNAGDTWNFQAWHRDNVGLGSNFTDGLEINFTN